MEVSWNLILASSSLNNNQVLNHKLHEIELELNGLKNHIDSLNNKGCVQSSDLYIKKCPVTYGAAIGCAVFPFSSVFSSKKYCYQVSEVFRLHSCSLL